MEQATRPPLRRLLILDRLIRAGRHPNANTLAKELEVHPRTIHRDIEFLRSSWGAPVEFCHQKNGFYYRDPGFSLPLLTLTEGDMVALFLGERLLQEYANTPYAAALAGLFRKITLSLPDEVSVDLNHLDQVFSVRQQKPVEKDAELFRELTRAIQKQQQLELLYWTAGRNETNRRVVDPYHLTSVQGDWYLVAYCHLREEVRMFVPGRIRQCRETGRTFERPADFRIEDYLDHSFKAFRGEGKPRTVRLRFAPALARHIRDKQFHTSQKCRLQRDGSLVVTIKVNHLLEVKRWAMSYGSDCEVLEPEELRQEILTEIKKLREMYG